MKFAVAVVMLALALGVQSGFVPLPYAAAPLSYTAVGGPGYYAAAPGSVAVHATPAVSAYSAPVYSAYSAPVISPYSAPVVSPYSAPLVSAYSSDVVVEAAPAAIAAAPAVAAAPVAVAAPAAVVAGEGTYVAQNRGAVHIAPLPGHANSASSVNLEPAPGTL